MFVDVHLLDTETGKRAVYQHDYEYPEGETFDTYLWEEGNYSCDCNRALFFYGYEDGENYLCGDSRFVVEKIVNRETGELLYSELTQKGI